MKRSLKIKFIIVVCISSFVSLFFAPAIPQDPGYHFFADSREAFGIPNFGDVISNLPLVIMGIVGLAALTSGKAPGRLVELESVYSAFFFGVFLTGLGSAYYHYQPNNAGLMFDRLPMTITFMAFFCVIVGENISPKAGRILLWPLLFIGPFSVVYWAITEARGHGDLRLYGYVQFMPLFLSPVILKIFRSKLTDSDYIWAVIIAYFAAKLAEWSDAQIYDVIHISGHTIKHLISAFAAYIFLTALRNRIPRDVIVKRRRAALSAKMQG